MKKFVAFCWLPFVLCPVAEAQVQSGTLVVAYYSKDQIAVAADSRSTDGPNGPPNDCYCKIAAISCAFYGDQIQPIF